MSKITRILAGLIMTVSLVACQKQSAPVSVAEAPSPSAAGAVVKPQAAANVASVKESSLKPKEATYDPNLKPAPIVYDKKQ